MQFASDAHKLIEPLKQVITKTGYQLRDIREANRAGSINEQIVNEIRRSKFMIADISELNANVMWEAGFARGLEIPVFYLCRQAAADKWKVEGRTLPFDTRNDFTIFWDLANLEESLLQPLEAAIRNEFNL